MGYPLEPRVLARISFLKADTVLAKLGPIITSENVISYPLEQQVQCWVRELREGGFRIVAFSSGELPKVLMSGLVAVILGFQRVEHSLDWPLRLNPAWSFSTDKQIDRQRAEFFTGDDL